MGNVRNYSPVSLITDGSSESNMITLSCDPTLSNTMGGGRGLVILELSLSSATSPLTACGTVRCWGVAGKEFNWLSSISVGVY